MINHFSAIISSFRGRFRRIEITPRGWLVRWLLGRSLSAQSSSVLRWVRLIAFAHQNSGEAVLLCYCVPLQYSIVLCVPSDVTLYRCYWYCVTAGTKRARDIQSGQRCSSLQCSWLYLCSWKESNRTGSWLPYRRHYGRTQLLQPHDFSCSNDPRPLFANVEAQLPAAPLLLLPHAPSPLLALILPRYRDNAVPFEYCQPGSELTAVPTENRQDCCCDCGEGTSSKVMKPCHINWARWPLLHYSTAVDDRIFAKSNRSTNSFAHIRFSCRLLTENLKGKSR